MEPSVPIMPSSNLCKESKSFSEKRSGPLEMSASIMPSSEKKRKSSVEWQTEVEEDAFVTRNLKPLEVSVHGMRSLTGKKSKSSSNKQTGVEEYADVSLEDKIINLEEEILEKSQHLGLMARICRLEMILDKFKAVKSGASSAGNPKK